MRVLWLFFGWKGDITVRPESIAGVGYLHAQVSGEGVYINQAPAATLIRALVDNLTTRSMLIDAIGRDAVKAHFGLVELSAPKEAV